ncbi:hypothetical protein D3C86_2175520 [compost metagenome]
MKHKQYHRFHPYDFEMSLLVRQGIITREEALKRVEDPEEKALRLAEQVEEQLLS